MTSAEETRFALPDVDEQAIRTVAVGGSKQLPRVQCTSPLNALPVRILRLGFCGPSPAPVATLWRSVLGRALREAVCVTRQAHCSGCLLRQQCIWPPLFEPTAPLRPRPFAGSATPPPPYALWVMRGADVNLNLRLFGSWAVAQTPLLLAQLGRAGRIGLGRARQSYRLESVRELHAAGDWRPWTETATELPGLPPPPTCPGPAHIELLAPLRLQRGGRLLQAGAFRSRDFVLAVLRRLQLLVWAHGDAPPPIPPLAEIESLQLSHVALRRHSEVRYSARQRTSVPLDGLVGQFTLTGSGLEALWPWLWAGQWTGAGKGTTQGLGVYRLADIEAEGN